jgi:hypothetical protein
VTLVDDATITPYMEMALKNRRRFRPPIQSAKDFRLKHLLGDTTVPVRIGGETAIMIDRNHSRAGRESAGGCGDGVSLIRAPAGRAPPVRAQAAAGSGERPPALRRPGHIRALQSALVPGRKQLGPGAWHPRCTQQIIRLPQHTTRRDRNREGGGRKQKR